MSVLVAVRCGMNQASMYEMRHSIVKAVSDFVEIEAEDMIEVNVTSEPEMGTVYSVAVPVRCPAFTPSDVFERPPQGHCFLRNASFSWFQ